MEMNYCRSADNSYCYFHPRDAVVGVCAVCLKERLLILLASKQGQLSTNKVDAQRRSCRALLLRRRSGISLPKVFALGSLLHRLDLRRPRPGDDSDDPESIASLEDSFISIKFEDNGNARWDNKKPPSTTIVRPSSNVDGGTTSSGGKGEIEPGIRSIVERAKKGGVLRWRKRIGHLLQLARWKRSSKATACHAGLAGGSTSAKIMEGGSVPKGRRLRSDKDSNQDQDHRHRHHRRHHK
uniref:Uncharacterized protein n=1 Tax=Ananas comosus var. bracteatus TaxID=296719 RepID=A0A6V7NHX4_ANACO|nr:unnamed protein product [Ananas comosus var. bracteatus]